MSIFVIYLHKPISAPKTTINIAKHFDFRFDSGVNKIVLTGRDNGPAIDFRSPEANLEIMDYNVSHLTIDTPVFMKWLGEFMDFCDVVNAQHAAGEGHPPFNDFLRAFGTFMTCDSGMTNNIASDFAKWSEEAENYGTDNFIGGYRHIRDAFTTASANGAVWVKHFPNHRAT